MIVAVEEPVTTKPSLPEAKPVAEDWSLKQRSRILNQLRGEASHRFVSIYDEGHSSEQDVARSFGHHRSSARDQDCRRAKDLKHDWARENLKKTDVNKDSSKDLAEPGTGSKPKLSEKIPRKKIKN